MRVCPAFANVAICLWAAPGAPDLPWAGHQLKARKQTEIGGWGEGVAACTPGWP